MSDVQPTEQSVRSQRHRHGVKAQLRAIEEELRENREELRELRRELKTLVAAQWAADVQQNDGQR